MIDQATSVYRRLYRMIGWGGWLAGLSLLAPGLRAQEVGRYQVRVVMLSGTHIRGTLQNVDAHGIYLDQLPDRDAQFGPATYVATEQVRKVVLYRKQHKELQIAGAVAGAIATGYVAHQSIQKSPPRSDFIYGLTVVLSAASGAAVGALLGTGANAIVDHANRRVLRPLFPGDTSDALSRQLFPFTEQYQRNLLNRPPTDSPLP